MSRNIGKVISYKNLEDIKDNRQFIFGAIWKVRDALINIPNIDRLNKRTYHFTRCVIIVDNSKENFNEDSLLISIAPISSKVEFKRKFDIDLIENEDDVLEDSILMLDYVQPMLKKDLYKCVGNISEEKRYELLESIMIKLGISNDEQEETDEQMAMSDEKKQDEQKL